MFTFFNPLFTLGPLSVPWLLVGALAALVPLIIHLSRSRKPKKMRFSTTRFFTDQFLRSYRMSRLKELLLLLCRMALCALLALALARPLFLPRGQSFFKGGTRSVALVLDDSASMGYVDNGAPLLERAKQAARELLDGLGPDDTVSLVLAGRRADGAEVVYDKKSVKELGDVLQAVNTTPVSALAGDLTAAVTRAEGLLASADASSKEIYVLSDLQENGFREGEEASPGGGSDVLYFFVKIRPPNPSNLAVTAVQYASARPMAGVPFLIRAHVAGQGEQAGPSEVRLVIDGQKVGEKPLDQLANNRWAVSRFYHTFANGGWHSGYVEVKDENLPADNRRYFALEVLDSVRVLAVNGAPSQVPRLDELFFLKTALTAAAEGKSAVEMDVVGPGAFGGADLGKYPLVILANVESLPAVAVEKLEGYVDRGGSLLVCLGDKVNKAFYNQSFTGAGRPNGGLFPGPLVDVETDPAGKEDFAGVAAVDYDHPALASFQDPRFASLAAVKFKALWKLDPGDSAVLMKATTGSPLLCERTFGKGRVLIFTSTADRDWTNFPVRPAYLPWAHRLVAYLAQEPLGHQGTLTTGDWLPVPVPSTDKLPQVLVEYYDAGKNSFRPLGPAATTEDPDVPLVFKNTTRPGIYRLTTPQSKDNSPLVAVNLPGEESRLTYVDSDDLAGQDAEKIEEFLKARVLPGRQLVTYVDDPAKVGQTAQEASRGRKLWDWLLVVVLVIALAEPWFANRTSLRHYGRPKEAEIKTARVVDPLQPGARGILVEKSTEH